MIVDWSDGIVETTDAGGIEARAVAATLVCVARVGLSKTTLDDIAREAGCGRATLYRYFGSRSALVDLAVRTELLAVGERIRARVARAATLADALTGLLVDAAREYEGHATLQSLLELERGAVLPFVTFRGQDRLLELAADVFAPDLERFLPGPDRTARARRCASWTSRIAVTYLLARDRPVDLTDEASARTLVEHFVLPAFAPAPTLG
ncbi:MAG: transcriptional regulator, TetR family [Actinomycetia bacterium]|nr:transcriptional regulator, TetR family [Actinomycetes bacterium]